MWVLADAVVANKVVVPLVGSTSRNGECCAWFSLLLLGLVGFVCFCWSNAKNPGVDPPPGTV